MFIELKEMLINLNKVRNIYRCDNYIIITYDRTIDQKRYVEFDSTEECIKEYENLKLKLLNKNIML